jgi:hypothetical protein
VTDSLSSSTWPGILRVFKTDAWFLKNFVFGKSSQSVSTIANCKIYTKVVNDTLIIMSLANKDDVVTSFVGWNQDIFLIYSI